jgi:gamma-glutamyl:cysteine ligase YbdK (ATP-grasp superfamily)
VGEEIASARFSAQDQRRFAEALREETATLRAAFAAGTLSEGPPSAGLELEAWLIDASGRPAPINEPFLQGLDEPLASPELARFNFELNVHPQALRADALAALEAELEGLLRRSTQVARGLGARVGLIGILPTLRPDDLGLGTMSDMNRYRALNEQVLAMRAGAPLRLEIVGRETLRSEHGDVMLESATTSFQIHLKAPASTAHHAYNAAIAASAPMVAASANAPFLFGHDLWEETRIPVFEQAVEVGGHADAAQGPLHRVSFGSGYARASIMECFEENLDHYPVLLPTCFEDSTDYPHLRLHNGTIWRWNRPLIGFEADGTAHVRIEHRVVPAGPTLADALANAALFFGLCTDLAVQGAQAGPPLSFAEARDNFYQAARHGLRATLSWDGARRGVRELLLAELLPRAAAGLATLGIEPGDARRHLGVLRGRIESEQTGAAWQRAWVEAHGRDWPGLTQRYLDLQETGQPVHEWAV